MDCTKDAGADDAAGGAEGAGRSDGLGATFESAARDVVDRVGALAIAAVIVDAVADAVGVADVVAVADTVVDAVAVVAIAFAVIPAPAPDGCSFTFTMRHPTIATIPAAANTMR